MSAEVNVLAAPGASALADPAAAFLAALDNPVAGPSLADLLQARKPARTAVIVPDRTRRNPELPDFLRLLLQRLAAGQAGRISLVTAYGTHPRQNQADHERLYGRENLSRVELVQHDARDPNTLADMGAMSTGNRLLLNARVARADLVIALGDITPHAFAGFSGGRKSILPGVAGYETIRRNHSRVGQAGVGLGRLAGNPIHEEMSDAARLAGLNYIINTVRNSAGEIIGMVGGEPEAAFMAGVKICRAANSVRLRKRADLVCVGCGGAPKDHSLYHAQRAVVAAVGAVKPGGTIVLFAEFPGGAGEPTLEKWLQKPLADILRLTPAEIDLGVHSAYLMARNLSHAEVLLWTDMPAATAASMHFKKVASREELAAFIRTKHGSHFNGILIPNGSQILLEVN